MKNISVGKIVIIVFIFVAVIFLQYRGFWSDLIQIGFKDSVIIFSESLSCVEEGKILSSTSNNYRKTCCSGLDTISLDRPDESKRSKNGCTWGTVGGVICAACGDGACGLGENICNCSKDCNSNYD